MAEELRNVQAENMDTERSPEEIADIVAEERVASAEIGEAVDPASEKVKKAKEFIKGADKDSKVKGAVKGVAKYAFDLLRVATVSSAITLWNLGKFIKEALTGKMSFKRGFELGMGPSERKNK